MALNAQTLLLRLTTRARLRHMQALVVLGLTFLAARWQDLGNGWRRFLVGGLTFDLTCGIVLHFAVQNFVLAASPTASSIPCRLR